MVEHNDNGLPPALREATRLLRDAPAPSDVWRQRLLRAIEAAPRPSEVHHSSAPRRWSMRPSTAIAAGLACVLLGGASAMLIMRNTVARRQLTAESRPATADDRSPVRFTFVAPAATQVSLVGDFNGWNPTALPLRRSPDGRTWEVVVPLAPGRYAYSFIVDGSLARDPAAPQAVDDDFGSVNSIVMVKGS